MHDDNYRAAICPVIRRPSSPPACAISPTCTFPKPRVLGNLSTHYAGALYQTFWLRKQNDGACCAD